MPQIMQKTKRGDTFIEVMFAFAIFSLVAIITLGTMNVGLSTSENSLELTVARNELNAQAEALRFIHSSYISELTLPPCDSSDTSATTKCQQFKKIWEDLISDTNVMSSSLSASNPLTIEYPLLNCNTVYEDTPSGSNLLKQNHAFVINTRQLISTNNHALSGSGYIDTDAIIRAKSQSDPTNIFTPAPLNARIIYSTDTGQNGEDDGGNNSATGVQSPTTYRRVARVEGIWVVAVRDSAHTTPRYYDFYIQTCWNGPNSKAPTSLDTIIRLYNPEGAI